MRIALPSLEWSLMQTESAPPNGTQVTQGPASALKALPVNFALLSVSHDSKLP
jgi:hypothetical protein